MTLWMMSLRDFLEDGIRLLWPCVMIRLLAENSFDLGVVLEWHW